MYKPATVDKDDTLTYDLGNLAACDYSTLSLPTLPGKSSTQQQRRDYESALRSLSRDNAQLLMNQIFALPSTPMPGDVGRLAALPAPTTALPRAKPLPAPKQPTKWEAFAKTKGIVNRKRSRMVFRRDDAGVCAQTWIQASGIDTRAGADCRASRGRRSHSRPVDACTTGAQGESRQETQNSATPMHCELRRDRIVCRERSISRRRLSSRTKSPLPK